VTKETQVDHASADRVKNFADISLGSPRPKSIARNKSEEKADLSAASEKESLAAATETTKRSERIASKKVKPIKLNLALPTPEPSEIATTKEEASTQNTPAVAPAPAPSSQIGSRPNTPLTGISRASDSSGPRQPRVLRVVDTPKTETPPPPSAVQSVSSAAASKARSRRPSLSSLSRPATPADVGSDYDLNTSASVSRANSPPPSRVGSAPIRAISKSQVKKERKLKAKQAEEAKKEESVVSAPVEEPVQAPIIGRKRKTKKAPASSSEQSTAATTTSNDAGKTSDKAESATDKEDQKPDAARKAAKSKAPAKDEKSVPVEEKQPEGKESAQTWKANNTIEQLIKDAEASGRPIKELFLERTSPLHVLLAQMHKTGAIDLNTHPLFNPPNLNQRTDMKCTADDHDPLKRPIELTEEQKKRLLRGEPVRIKANSDLLKDRCLITPRGCVLRHLSPEEEDRYLELEKRVSLEVTQEYPAISMPEPDTTNMNGGLDALFATPEKFNLHWVDASPQSGLSLGSAGAVLAAVETAAASSTTGSAPPNVLSAMEADTTRSHNWAIANTAELVNATAASVRSFAAATAKHMLGAAGVVLGEIPDIEDVRAMSDEELRSYIERSQRELESSRKDFESLDKKFNVLVKRNKKLAQQALVAAVEVGK
jgi:CCR4-NOT transcription complex subunit 4